MIDARIDRFVSQQPMEELPADARKISTGLHGFDETHGPRYGLVVRQALENAILKPCQHPRYPETRLILSMIPRVDGAANRTAPAVLPILAFDNCIGLGVGAELLKNRGLGESRVFVECDQHLVSLIVCVR